MKYIIKNINEIDKNILDDFYNSIYPIKKNRINKDNYLSIYAEYILSELLKEYNLDYNNITISENSNGKPYIVNSNIYYSISHSNNYVMVAINDSPIGIDIQYRKKINNNIINKIANESEKEYDLYKLFSLKESYIKCLGLDYSSMKDITFFINNKISSNHEDLEFITLNIIPNYEISICTKKDF